jgi:hypothetical protein
MYYSYNEAMISVCGVNFCVAMVYSTLHCQNASSSALQWNSDIGCGGGGDHSFLGQSTRE